ncbi:hypothetical protein DOTSEDRAFT_70257 [Lecanosticta acicola]|uniref:Uncharacterized protein n=1 Tax=Lecanosticta acicola TaxID=111012 RepID=A0AAI8YS62_9PEZI|nr:hypothetical protein DOTSEDRAFT_70257 [Lecanosticta acicola]
MDARSIAESQKGLRTAASSIRMDRLDQKRRETAFTKELTIGEASRDISDGSTRPGHHRNYGAAVFDLIVAALPLYFVAFAFLAYAQNGTRVDLPLNQVLLKMASFNPTAFPIVFTLLSAKFIKSVANWKLERSTSVGTIQSLLGSRSLATSIITPFKIGVFNFAVLIGIAFWLLDPVGGQASLRLATRDSNSTTLDANFDYLDINTSPFGLLDAPSRLASINGAFNAALLSPASSKNGSQDLYGNLQVPLLEVLKDSQKADSNGWYRIAELVNASESSTSTTALDQFLGLDNDADPSADVTASAYASLVGMPFLQESSSDGVPSTASAVNIETQFSMESSYFYADCSVEQSGSTEDSNDFASSIDTGRGVVSNGRQFSMSYDQNHTTNSTQPRAVVFTSWNGHSSGSNGDITTATCQLTTTYIEANVYCATNSSCSILAMRASLLDHPKPSLTQLDGIAPTWNATSNHTQSERHAIPELFFSGLINATGNETDETGGLSPIECYFLHPEDPYSCDGNGQYTLYSIRNDLFSYRATQLLNTYWLANIAPFSVTGNFKPNNTRESGVSRAVQGQVRVETTVLRCHTHWMILLVAISIVLFLAGMATAYLDATRKIPDVLDYFANSLQYNPYVHVERVSSMEEGAERARRLKDLRIQMGDVRPDDPAGYIAIGTPGYKQPIRMVSAERRYR